MTDFDPTTTHHRLRPFQFQLGDTLIRGLGGEVIVNINVDIQIHKGATEEELDEIKRQLAENDAKLAAAQGGGATRAASPG